MPLVHIPESSAHMLLVGHADMRPEVGGCLMHFLGVDGHHLLLMAMHGREEGVHIFEGLLVHTANFD